MGKATRERIFLRLDAPFAACRPFVAGWYRPTAAFLTHSAVYGLLLNVAGIESRLWEHEAEHPGNAPASLMREGLPTIRLALGKPDGNLSPRVETIFQQLHNYPVGASGMPPELTKGTKNNITPVRREMLCDVHAIAAVECEYDFAASLRRGLSGESTGRQYGLPFLGDNAFLLDRLEEIKPRPVCWYERVDPAARPINGTFRTTLRVDHADMSKTKSELFAPSTEMRAEPNDAAWTDLGN
jgi:CRISPR-associated protein Cas5t